MSDARDADSWDESEFGLGEGMIDSGLRTDGRDAMPNYMKQWEILAMPKSFDGSMLNRPTPETTPVPKLAPGEIEADRG